MSLIQGFARNMRRRDMRSRMRVESKALVFT